MVLELLLLVEVVVPVVVRALVEVEVVKVEKVVAYERNQIVINNMSIW